MKLLVLSKVIVLASLLMSFVAVAEDNTDHSGFPMGLLIGSLIALLILSPTFLYFCRQYRHAHARLLLKFKQSKREVYAIKKSMDKLVEEQQDSQDLLEDRVQERTIELNIALQELESVNQELERKNIIDELTGLHNRRFYDQKILAEYRRSRRNRTPLSLVLIDIDHFKAVNDNYGHLAGDHCLVSTAKHLLASLKRSTDKAFRYGGEEFCLTLPDTDAEGALLIAEKLRELVSKQVIQFEDIDITVTISCGICTYEQQAGIGPEQIFAGADKALYKAKHNGRNQSHQHTFTE